MSETSTPVDLSTATVSDALSRVRGGEAAAAAMSTGLRAVAVPGPTAGRAHTIRVSVTDAPPPDALDKWFRAFEAVGPGEVVVVEMDQSVETAIVGDVMGFALRQSGCVALLTDGVVRDSAGLRETGLGVWARGTHMQAFTSIAIETEQGIDVTCSSVRISSGDLVVADEDGFIVVAQDDVDEVMAAAQEVSAREEVARARLAQGERLGSVYGPQS